MHACTTCTYRKTRALARTLAGKGTHTHTHALNACTHTALTQTLTCSLSHTHAQSRVLQRPTARCWPICLPLFLDSPAPHSDKPGCMTYMAFLRCPCVDPSGTSRCCCCCCCCPWHCGCIITQTSATKSSVRPNRVCSARAWPTQRLGVLSRVTSARRLACSSVAAKMRSSEQSKRCFAIAFSLLISFCDVFCLLL